MVKAKYDSKIVSKRIKKKRNEFGMTQQNLSDKSGISINSVKSYESGRRIPDNFNLQQLAQVLRVDPLYLLGETDFQNKWDEYTKNHPKEVESIKQELKFVEYCEEVLGYDFSEFDEELWEEFLKQCNESIMNIYKKIRKDV